MILQHKDDLSTFRSAVRDWIAATLANAPAASQGDDGTALQRWWFKKRSEVGLATPHWPTAYGGGDLSLAHQIVLADEFAKSGAPSSELYVISLFQLAGTLFAWGSEEQNRRYLPRVAEGEIWCQGFSEPGAGSDLAAIKTRGVRDGDHYVVNGQKLWSTNAIHADFCLLLMRTNSEGKKQEGLTYLIMDMHAEGVDVRPIRKANGLSEFAEIFLTDVRIPVINRIGAENQGWLIAQSTLGAERGLLVFESFERLFTRITAFHADQTERSAAWLQDDQLRREFTRLLGRIQAIRLLIRRLLRETQQEAPPPSILPAFIKLTASDLSRRAAGFMLEVEEIAGQVDHGRETGALFDYLSSFGSTIAAGTNEVMRNIIAERGLGLPKGR